MSPRLSVLALALPIACGGCHNMVRQARTDTYEASPLFPQGMAMQHPPSGAVALEDADARAAAQPPPLNRALIDRGRERFAIDCVPCHGLDGAGDGIVPQRGFPHPPDFRSDRLRRAPASHFVDVMTNGYGAMFSYADRVSPRDRWAIASYIRVLQRASAPLPEPTS